MGGGAAVGSDHSVCTVVLDPHQGCLANLAGLRTLEGQDDDRFAFNVPPSIPLGASYSSTCLRSRSFRLGSYSPLRGILKVSYRILVKSGPCYAGNIVPNTSDPLCDSSLVASSCRTSHVPQRWCRCPHGLVEFLLATVSHKD